MEEFNFSWEAIVQRSVVIEANSLEEAHQKWVNGEYGKTDVDDEDLRDDFVEINGETYFIFECEKYK